MGDIVVVFFLQNVLLFSCILWIITFIAEFFYCKKNNTNAKKFYECGFRTLSELNIQFNLNFSMLCVFLILYDIEFLFLYPIIFNYNVLSLLSFIILFFFIGVIFFSLIYDIRFNSLSWQI